MEIAEYGLVGELDSIVDDMVAVRRQIHQYPETAFEEVRTAELVANSLARWGITVHQGMAETGVIGVLKSGEGKRRISLRADMDALHIEERNDVPYRSANSGRMHACGHDGHTAMLLGAAKYLSSAKNFDGVVQFIFQPAEEGLGGARVMIEEGLFKEFPCDAIYGLHNMPGFKIGSFVIRHGTFMAASDTWSLTMRGTGGHGSQPHVCTDASLAAAEFIVASQSIVSRSVSYADSAVISVGHVSGGSASAPSVMPSVVTVKGTARSFRPEVRDLIETRLKEVAEHVANIHNVTSELNYQRRYPPLRNHDAQTQIAIEAAAGVVGRTNVVTDTSPFAVAEDFAFMLEKVPGAYIFLGNGLNVGDQFLHAPKYDFNDEAIGYGISYWVEIVRAELPIGPK